MPHDPGDAAEPLRSPGDVFADWVRRRLGDGAESFDELVAARPELADELRRRKQEWAEGILQGAGLSPNLQEELSLRFGPGVDPQVQLEADDGDSGEEFTGRVIGRLAGRGGSTRYRLKGEVAEGGMGAILRVWDEDLRRHLAMKVVLGRRDAGDGGDTPPVDPNRLARFLEEAQVTGQLDHPNIVPVHELGLDAEGRAYFTMKLVKGRDLKAIFDLVRDGAEGWNLVKALGVLQRVCEAMSYAHDKGVIHRDLKPANVMVGRYGEVYVMDWGLAKILGRADAKDLRIRPEDASSAATVIRSDRKEAASDTPDSPLYTMDGDVVGTPAYMPPEQASGDLEALGPRSDVYAVGAMLYHLLAGHMPYVREGEKASSYAIWRWVREGPPTGLAKEAPGAPLELVSIAERAMARAPGDRYADMAGMAADLAAFVEGRVVAAHETGAWAEARKWVQRDRPLAASLAAAVLFLVAGVIGTSLLARAERLRDEGLARERELLVRGLIPDLERFRAQESDLAIAQGLDEPTHVWWLREARLLLEGRAEDSARGQRWQPGLAEVERRLALLRAGALDRTEEDVEADRRAHPRFAELEGPESELLWHRRLLGEAPWPAEDEVLAALGDDALAGDADELNGAAWERVDPDAPLFGEETAGRLLAERAVERAEGELRAMALDTLALARLRCGDVAGARAAMAAALDAAGEARREDFEGYRDRLAAAIEGQGESALRERAAALDAALQALRWRFVRSDVQWWHDQLAGLAGDLRDLRRRLDLASRSVETPEARAAWDAAARAIAASPHYGGRWLAPQIGLLPIGADPTSGLWEFAHLASGTPAVRGADGVLELAEETGAVFVLLPGGTFWMGAQRKDRDGQNFDPAAFDTEGPVHAVALSPYFLSKYELSEGQWARLGGHPSRYAAGPLFPAQDLSWEQARDALRRAGAWLVLPTEAQWESACRGGTTSPWWTGTEASSLVGVEWIAVDDQDPQEARRIGGGLANPFGLHDVHGNVSEWCRDNYESPYSTGVGGRADPVVSVSGSASRVYRGGSFNNPARFARSAYRYSTTPESRVSNRGLRPARGITTRDFTTSPTRGR